MMVVVVNERVGFDIQSFACAPTENKGRGLAGSSYILILFRLVKV